MNATAHFPALPATMQLVAQLIGMPRTLQLVQALGGTTLPFSKNQSRAGQLRFAALADVIGQDAAELLTRHFGGDILYIPRCSQALRQARNQQLIRDFDALLIDGLGANEAVGLLAMRYRLSDRMIWRVLKTPPAPHEVH
ncbi:Mor transcription activator family protein [Chromobacterium subtsugae]|uniref:Mor transcription activator family protein n=1 Tax=Chromobacterium subtsugae TaxID=251747 RepID=UPI000640DE7A|nr:Mor transcription activator family protein [Chromobacterium subtsugae]